MICTSCLHIEQHVTDARFEDVTLDCSVCITMALCDIAYKRVTLPARTFQAVYSTTVAVFSASRS